MLEKFKSFLANDALFYAVLLILVAIASFGLGRQSGLVSSDLGVIKEERRVEILQPQAPQAAAITTTAQEGSIVASKSGTKYHLTTCPGASQIKESNKIYFGSREEAEGAGYTPAANCSF